MKIHVKDPKLFVVRVGYCFEAALQVLSLYGLYVLNNMIKEGHRKRFNDNSLSVAMTYFKRVQCFNLGNKIIAF